MLNHNHAVRKSPPATACWLPTQGDHVLSRRLGPAGWLIRKGACCQGRQRVRCPGSTWWKQRTMGSCLFICTCMQPYTAACTCARVRGHTHTNKSNFKNGTSEGRTTTLCHSLCHLPMLLRVRTGEPEGSNSL